MSYRKKQQNRSQETSDIAAAVAPDQVERPPSSEASSLRKRLKLRIVDLANEHLPPSEGLDTGYEYAPAVGSSYRGKLRPSDDYVAVFNDIEERGIAAGLETNGKQHRQSNGHRSRSRLRRAR